MHDKYATLLSRVPAGTAVVPAGSYVVALNEATNRVQEFGAGRAIPAATPQLSVYAIPTEPFEALFYVQDAILCLKPDGSQFRPGMCLKLKLSYVSATGLLKLLLTSRMREGRSPDCITLENLHTLLSREINAICARCAQELSHRQTLSYTRWWNDIAHGTAYRDLLYTPLMQLFTAHGLRLDKAAFAIAGVAPAPLG